VSQVSPLNYPLIVDFDYFEKLMIAAGIE